MSSNSKNPNNNKANVKYPVERVAVNHLQPEVPDNDGNSLPNTNWITQAALGILVLVLIGLASILNLFPELRWTFIKVTAFLGLVGVYPITYLAYWKVSDQTKRNLLKTDFRLLGLVSEDDLNETVEKLYLAVYSWRQFLVYIFLIIVVSFSIFFSYLNRGGLGLSESIQTTVILIFYSYLGASVFSILQVIRRYNTFDLQPQVYSSIFVRIFMAATITFVGAAVITLAGGQLAAEVTEIPGPKAWAAVLAFVIGVFPDRGLRWFVQRTNQLLNSSIDQENMYSLKNIIGISTWHEARLAEMGIDNAQNLATVDIRKLLLTTQFDTQEIAHWIDQAILYVKVGQKIDRFRDAKMPTFHEFRLALDDLSLDTAETLSKSERTARNEARKRLSTVLGGTDPDELDRLADASNFPNYTHIAEYYSRMAMVARQHATTGMGIIVGDIEETNFKQAIDNAINLLRQNPNDPEVLTTLGVAYYGLAQENKISSKTYEQTMQKAYNAYTQAIAADAQMVRAYYSRSVIYTDRGEYKKALQDCSLAIDIDPFHAHAFNNHGLAHMHLGYLDLAIADFNKALALDRRLANAYANRGYTYSEMGDVEMALLDFEKADLLGYRKHSLFWFRWGQTFSKIGKHTEAIEKLTRAISHDPHWGRAYAQRGDSYLQLGREYHPQARADLQQSIENSTDENKKWLSEVYTNLGILETREKNFDEAIAHYLNALKIDEKKYSASYHLSTVYKEKKQTSELRQALNRLLEIAPDDSFELLQGRRWLSELEATSEKDIVN